ncbi:MAG: aminotransferase class I/II-fold pyridoxal phosphate-dependent enzyme [Deltaproteobacteria bacterium]|nr:aminotransferase class I/II-fold pyridoxal phosphate-dependent enzyme [Deltaproteobacteria bacterium]
MSGFLSSDNIDTNRIELERQAMLRAGMQLADATCSNPTLTGYLFPQSILKEGFNHFLRQRKYSPDGRGLHSARLSIVEYYKKRGLILSPESVFLTASTSESYSLLFSLLADAGDNFLVPSISYPLFDYFSAHAKVEMVPY